MINHICFSGSLMCSGINPCDGCQNAIRSVILPKALVGAGLNHAEQAQGFLLAWRSAWQELHRMILENPSAVKMTDLSPLYRTAETLAAPAPSVASSELVTPEEMASQQAAAAPAEAPASSVDGDGTLLGEGVNLMGPLSSEQLATIFAKAERMTEPTQETTEAGEASAETQPESKEE